MDRTTGGERGGDEDDGGRGAGDRAEVGDERVSGHGEAQRRAEDEPQVQGDDRRRAGARLARRGQRVALPLPAHERREQHGQQDDAHRGERQRHVAREPARPVAVPRAEVRGVGREESPPALAVPAVDEDEEHAEVGEGDLQHRGVAPPGDHQPLDDPEAEHRLRHVGHREADDEPRRQVARARLHRLPVGEAPQQVRPARPEEQRRVEDRLEEERVAPQAARVLGIAREAIGGRGGGRLLAARLELPSGGQRHARADAVGPEDVDLHHGSVTPLV